MFLLFLANRHVKYVMYANVFLIFLLFFIDICNILQTTTIHKTASVADEGNSAYSTVNLTALYINIWKLA